MPRAVRPKFSKVPEEMQQWAGLLEAELASWPAVTARRMFGMIVFYRKGVIFAALPRTKMFASPHAVAFKFYKIPPRLRKLLEADTRVAHPVRENGRWISFEIGRDADLKDALSWFERAYESAGKES